jgi:hypothetical protein
VFEAVVEDQDTIFPALAACFPLATARRFKKQWIQFLIVGCVWLCTEAEP